MPKGNSICIKTYWKPEEFAEVAKFAERAGKRRGGLLLYIKKPHGFADEMLAHTTGCAKFLKYAAYAWADREADRLEQAAEIKQQEKEIAEKKAKLGIK